MPQLRFRGVTVEQVCLISKSLVEELAEICECGTDNFTLECVHTTAVYDGEIVQPFPFVEVAWFDRGRHVRNRFAQAVTGHIHHLGIPKVEVAFVVYREDSYYINGEPCE
jgi:hypothetical protein